MRCSKQQKVLDFTGSDGGERKARGPAETVADGGSFRNSEDPCEKLRRLGYPRVFLAQ